MNSLLCFSILLLVGIGTSFGAPLTGLIGTFEDTEDVFQQPKNDKHNATLAMQLDGFETRKSASWSPETIGMVTGAAIVGITLIFALTIFCFVQFMKKKAKKSKKERDPAARREETQIITKEEKIITTDEGLKKADDMVSIDIDNATYNAATINDP